MALWNGADPQERDEIVADIQESLDDYQDAPQSPMQKPYIDFDKLGDVAQEVLAKKAKLRDIIDRNGGVSAVAKRAGIAQPSLSRMLNSPSMPRRSTLYRIANAAGPAGDRRSSRSGPGRSASQATTSGRKNQRIFVASKVSGPSGRQLLNDSVVAAGVIACGEACEACAAVEIVEGVRADVAPFPRSIGAGQREERALDVGRVRETPRALTPLSLPVMHCALTA